ncbi:ABC transporter substrate-binding protein [Micromonospora sp. WMMD1102]|uniref:peptide ABC transporter substrate-binding protein n=1 Tax=Micromonospora sp. WMMD1102 TaxID=3016105 RepID=UPI00241533E1|nr:ABC transporter substrate-binding protein [Micromonospora sp. WMMD1102]MDG4789850.1 ABC transporter substrate-binding protein [Micromonospora sp. WMMD1102]
MLLAAGCGGGGDDESSAADALVSIGVGEPQHLIPSNTTESNGAEVLAALFSPLVDFDADNKPYTVAAESVESTDNKVWTIKLKDGYTFHNGEKVGADNYINAWNHAAYGPNGNGGSYFFERIEGYKDLQSEDPDGEGPKKAPEPAAKTMTGLKKVDDLTFTVTLSEPFSGWRSVMGYTVFYPLPAAAWASEGVLKEDYEQAPIGNGPFKMKGTWQHDSKIEVERYDAYPGDKPKVGGVTYKIYQEQTAQYADLMGGALDVVTQIPIENLATAPADLGDRFKTGPNSVFQFVGFPTFLSQYSKVEVRKAISMAINRKEITDNVFRGAQTPATSFVSPAVAGYRENSCGEPCTYDPAKAKAAYDAAGGPKQIKITYNADGGHKAWVDATCNQLKTNLGVDCVGVGEPKFADLLTKVENKEDVGMIRLGWIMDYPLMENYLGPLYGTNGSSNYYGYSNPEFDNLVKQGSAAATEDEAIKLWQQAEDILARDMPVIPLRLGQNVYGHSERVKNVELDKFQKVELLKIEATS